MTNGTFVASTISVNGMIPNRGMVVVPRSWRRSIIVVDGIHRGGLGGCREESSRTIREASTDLGKPGRRVGVGAGAVRATSHRRWRITDTLIVGMTRESH